MNIILIALAIRHNGDWDKIFEALEKKEKVSINELRTIEESLKKSKYKIITILDKDYPSEFKNIYKPPFCIWLKGDINSLKGQNICVAGNQKDTFSSERIQRFVPKIENAYNIISPNFVGIDKEIIAKTQNPLLYILPSGFDRFNAFNERDVFISEYPTNVPPEKIHFKNRNRLIAGLSDALILFTSKKRGKINSLITEFLNLGKEIYAFPGDGSEQDGNSELIKQGANLITSIKDITTN